jgi:transcriptional regulator with XRE-family HTH domain
MDILKRIKKLQKMRGWSNYRLAKESHVSEGSLNNLFRLGNLPTISTLEALCSGLGITMAQFFADSGEPIALTPDQSEMLTLWDTLTDVQKKAALELFRAFSANSR